MAEEEPSKQMISSSPLDEAEMERAEELAKSLLNERSLCEFCLGSHLATLMRPAPNWVKGELLLKRCSAPPGKAAENAGRGLSGDCWVCGGLTHEPLSKILEDAVRELRKYEFHTVKAGTILPVEVVEREDELRARTGLWTVQTVKVTISRYADSHLSKEFEVSVDPQEPEMLVLVDLDRRVFELRPSSAYVFGRYRKLSRGVYQARWSPDQKGELPHSVESLIGSVMVKAFGGGDYVLHAAGREDVDVRMLGRGRPFVMELVEPRKRRVDLRELEVEVNSHGRGMVEVGELALTNRRAVAFLKESSGTMRKRYRALVEVEGEISGEELRALEEALSNGTVEQRTPTRVKARRADRVRLKRVYRVQTQVLSPSSFELIMECDGGLYVKELISGDGERTTPSVSEVLGKKAFCMELDVMEVIAEDLLRGVGADG